MSLQTWHPHILHTTQTTFSDTDQYTPPQSTLQTHESGLAIPILTTYLSTPTSSPETTAAALASICTTRIQSGDVSAPEGIWKVFCSAIDFFGGDESTRERLVALLMSLANIEVRGEDGRVVESSLNADVFWRQLPGYSLAFRDEMTCPRARNRGLRIRISPHGAVDPGGGAVDLHRGEGGVGIVSRKEAE
ncbi:hypothetical protein HYFRA_00013301 [Hymenoscyphus fraxineus]|uniref:Uncharacterized protein n=1 Tax=Hymenoscyphus fraxineus TaxID=746836 RepID=A0A9N9LBL5_9HELO|nr:hypothetical protein HYFRA_00013301 [Hymenoscyphus fraxineus]